MNTQYKQLTQKDRGFTIIEVVLVLAIAGLIFLMVFLALPALQRGQRDTAKKNDASIIATAISNYSSNNKGDLTNLTATNIQSYIESLSQYDKAADITVQTAATALTVGSATASKVYVQLKARCPTSIDPGTSQALTAAATPAANVIGNGGSKRQAIVIVTLENNGTAYQGYCQEL